MKVLEFTKFPMEFFKGWFWDKNQICFFQDEGSVEEDRLERLEKLIMKRNKRWAGMITKMNVERTWDHPKFSHLKWWFSYDLSKVFWWLRNFHRIWPPRWDCLSSCFPSIFFWPLSWLAGNWDFDSKRLQKSIWMSLEVRTCWSLVLFHPKYTPLTNGKQLTLPLDPETFRTVRDFRKKARML